MSDHKHLAAMLREAAESGMAQCYNDDFLAAAAALEARPAPATEGVEAIISDDLMKAVGLGVIYKTKSSGVETDKPDILATEKLFCTAYVALHKARAALSASRPSGEAKLRESEVEAAAQRMHAHLHEGGGPPWGIWSEMFPDDANRVRGLARAAISDTQKEA